MIKQEITTSILRFYSEDTDNLFEPFVGVCTLLWETSTVVWIKGLHGTISRKHLRELISFCVANNIETLKAYREPGRAIPFMEPVGNHFELSVNLVAGIINPV